MIAREYCFPELFPPNKAQENIAKVWEIIFALFDDCVASFNCNELGKRIGTQGGYFSHGGELSNNSEVSLYDFS